MAERTAPAQVHLVPGSRWLSAHLGTAKAYHNEAIALGNRYRSRHRASPVQETGGSGSKWASSAPLAGPATSQKNGEQSGEKRGEREVG